MTHSQFFPVSSPRAIVIVALLSGALGTTYLEPTPAAAARPLVQSDPWTLCSRAIAAAERRMGIPDQLLVAISLAESGRRHPSGRAVVAWPWTVMAEGRGQYLPTKAEAIQRVRSLKARGVRNIDVGCMQVNLKFHPDAFANLQEAFEPTANAAYAAKFLASLRVETGSWDGAMGRYHSATPRYAEPYKKKVAAIWKRQRRNPSDENALPPTEPVVAPTAPPARLAPVDPIRTAKVARGRSTLIRSTSTASPRRDAASAARFAARRAEQLTAWRNHVRRLRAEQGQPNG